MASQSYQLSLLRNYDNSYQYTVSGIVPRWWYIAVSNCESGPNKVPGPMAIKYFLIHFTNRNGIFSYEFSKMSRVYLK